MTAIQVIAELMNLVEKHGDRELVVYDGSEHGDKCVVGSIEVQTLPEDVRAAYVYFHLTPGEYVPTWESFKDDNDPMVRAARTRLIGEIAKALSANSPFLTLINGGKFPEKVAEESCGLCNSTDPDHNCPCR